MNLLICTPCGDGKPESIFKDSLIKTRELLREQGIDVTYLELPYCSDVYIARAKLFTAFVNKPEKTHMLFIDADTGWNPEDVVRMLKLNRDFLAAVAPQKKYPIEFAFSLLDEKGEKQPIDIDMGTKIAEVKEVGAAFLLISRSCAERMVEAYPELYCDEIYFLYDPLFVGNRRFAEDYAFCYRWRQIGGKVEVLLDVTLTHVGSHAFTGSLLENIENQLQPL